MKKIIVPVDFSELSELALEFAIETAKVTQAHVEVLHVIELAGANLYGQDIMGTSSIWIDNYMKDMQDLTKKKMEKLQTHHQYPHLNAKVEVGSPYTHIANTVAEHEADLVIMGTHGASGLNQVFVGSNAEKVVRACICPVLVIKEAVKVDQIKNIAVGLHWKEVPDDLMMNLKQLQNMFKAHLSLVWVNTPANFERDGMVYPAMEKLAEKHLLADFSIHIYNDFFEDDGLRHFATKHQVDMIAIGTHGRSGLANFVAGSVAGDLVNEAHWPIWSYKIRK